MDYKKIYRRIEKRYIIWIIVLTLLFVSRQAIIQYQINLGKDMSGIVNISGRQRMLSQKISKDILMIYISEDREELDYYREDLKESIDLWEKSHYNLINGNKEEGLAERNSIIIMDRFQKIEPYFNNILKSAKRILNLSVTSYYDKEFILEETKIINKNEKVFLEKMDGIVSQYNLESENTMSLIETTELVLFILIIGVLAFISLFSFRPAGKTMKHALEKIDEGNENIKRLFYSMRGSLFLVKENGDIMTMNSDGEKIINHKIEENQNLNIKTSINWIGIDILEMIKEAKTNQASKRIEASVEDKNKNMRTMMVSVSGGTYNGEHTILINAFDITAQKKAEEVLKNIANKDELSGLYNRRFLETMIDSEFKRSQRYQYPISAIILDIDKFKNINDKWGHPVGDIVIKEIADILVESSRESDNVFRIGGEEFVVIMPHTNLDQAFTAAEKFRKNIEKIDNPVVGKYTASFGVAQREDFESYENLYNRMDQALYEAKESGRNRTVKSIK